MACAVTSVGSVCLISLQTRASTSEKERHFITKDKCYPTVILNQHKKNTHNVDNLCAKGQYGREKQVSGVKRMTQKVKATRSQSKSSMKQPNQKAQKAGSVFQRLFRKQQPKVSANKKVSNVLKTFAEDDYRRIAVLIQAWLEKDQKKGRH